MEISFTTYNICFRCKEHGIRHGWDRRKQGVLDFLEQQRDQHKPHIFCLQEATPEHIKDVKDLFHESTHYVFTKKYMRRVDMRFVTVMSREIGKAQIRAGIAGAYYRRFCVIELDDLLIINVHLPMDVGKRIEWTVRLNLFLKKQTKRVIICGDFNSFADRDGPRLMADVESQSNLLNATRNLPDLPGSKKTNLFWGFSDDPHVGKETPFNIDHILHSQCIKSTPAVITRMQTFQEVVQGLRDPSDHFPVTTMLTL